MLHNSLLFTPLTLSLGRSMEVLWFIYVLCKFMLASVSKIYVF